MIIDRSLPDLFSGSLPQYSFTALFSHEISAYYYINTFKIRICQTFHVQFFFSKPVRVGMKKAKLLRVDKKIKAGKCDGFRLRCKRIYPNTE